MKFYDVEGFPNPACARIVLAEKGAKDRVEFVPVDMMGGEHRTKAFKARNPEAVVPCPELAGGTYISHCHAVTEFIGAALADFAKLDISERLKTCSLGAPNIRTARL